MRSVDDARSGEARQEPTPDAHFHAAQRSLAGLGLSLGLLVLVPMAMHSGAIAAVFGNAPNVVMAGCGAIALTAIVTTWAYFAKGVDSAVYAWLDGAETIVVQLVLDLFVFTSTRPFSPFWVMYILHCSNGAYGYTTTRWHRVLGAVVAGVPLLLGAAIALRGDSVRAAVFALMAMAGANAYFHAGQTASKLAQAASDRLRLETELGALRVADERRRIARDLHDGLGADLAAIAWRTAALAQRAPSATERASLTQLTHRATGGIDEIRSVVWSLDADERRWSEVVSYLRSRSNELATDSLSIRFEADARDDDPILRGPFTSHLIRVTLEAVRNAAQHGSGADICVGVRWKDVIEIRVENVVARGKGASDGAAPAGSGLHNMRARARALGGELSITEADDRHVVVLRAPPPAG